MANPVERRTVLMIRILTVVQEDMILKSTASCALLGFPNKEITKYFKALEQTVGWP